MLLTTRSIGLVRLFCELRIHQSASKRCRSVRIDARSIKPNRAAISDRSRSGDIFAKRMNNCRTLFKRDIHQTGKITSKNLRNKFRTNLRILNSRGII